MKKPKTISCVLAVVLLLAAGVAMAQTNPNRQAGVYIASAYNYDIDSIAGSGLGGPFVFPQITCQGVLPGRNLNPFNVNASVLVQDANSAKSETVAFVSQLLFNNYCVLNLTASKDHVSYHLRSGTFGLQEAINDATSSGGGNVVVDTQWGGTTAMITAAHGNSNVSITDNRTGSVLYIWNGANYVPAAITGSTYSTISNCAVNSVSPAACGSAPAGAVVIPTSTTSYVINTTAVTANSRIFLQPMTWASNLPSAPTCVAPASGFLGVSASTAATSFTVTLPSTTGTVCLNYWIVN
jgi:hypothetical protein